MTAMRQPRTNTFPKHNSPIYDNCACRVLENDVAHGQAHQPKGGGGTAGPAHSCTRPHPFTIRHVGPLKHMAIYS